MVRELSEISDKVKFEIIQASEGMEHTIAICNAEGEDLGLHFHGVPGGHEFNSFILAMYNAAGPGQDIGKDAEARVATINEKKHLNIAVSLSCTMCPDLVAHDRTYSLQEIRTSQLMSMIWLIILTCGRNITS